MANKLPHKFDSRLYQRDVERAFFIDKYKRFINIWHRRAGKDRLWFNILLGAAIQRVGMYVYAFPTLTLGRRALWEARGKDGIRFLDQVPKDFLKKVNHTEMKIELVNGSIIRLGGTDHYNSWVGTNVLGVVFSEYAVQNPLAWDLIRPILTENGGWASFIYTPRGGNHGYELYKQNVDNDKWFVSLLTIDDTKDNAGNSIMTTEMVEEERIAGMSEDMIQQEFYCSFDAALRGAIFSRQLEALFEEGRCLTFPMDETMPVYTSWDIGWSDSTTIWFFQKEHNSEYWKLIYYYENESQPIYHYVEILKDFKNKFKVSYGGHFLPHDAANHNIATGITLLETIRNLNVEATIIPCISEKEEAIELGRFYFNKFKIHKENCSQGLECLKNYCKMWYEKLGIYSEKPLHNWASHGADSFMGVCQVLDLKLIDSGLHRSSSVRYCDTNKL